MNKYDEMVRMFLTENPNEKEWYSMGWTKEKMRQCLIGMEKEKQLFEYRNRSGKLMAFIGWVRCTDEMKAFIQDKKPMFSTNTGPHILPLFAASRTGIGIQRKIGKWLLQKAKNQGGKILSYRNRRIMEFGRI